MKSYVLTWPPRCVCVSFPPQNLLIARTSCNHSLRDSRLAQGWTQPHLVLPYCTLLPIPRWFSASTKEMNPFLKKKKYLHGAFVLTCHNLFVRIIKSVRKSNGDSMKRTIWKLELWQAESSLIQFISVFFFLLFILQYYRISESCQRSTGKSLEPITLLSPTVASSVRPGNWLAWCNELDYRSYSGFTGFCMNPCGVCFYIRFYAILLCM